jgi:hypothetical protein
MRPIFLFTDFGIGSHYVGQLHALLTAAHPAVAWVDLCHELTPCAPRAAAYLLAALFPYLPESGVLVGVVDPGVGTDRTPILVHQGHWSFVGPDNGLFGRILHRAPVQVHEIPNPVSHTLSPSFHGRDLFLPWAIRLAQEAGEPRAETRLRPHPAPLIGSDWPEDSGEIIHIDRFGNATTGYRGSGVGTGWRLHCGSRELRFAPVFGSVPAGHAFWYVNSIGLVEIACNRDSAARVLDLSVGQSVDWRVPDGETASGSEGATDGGRFQI